MELNVDPSGALFAPFKEDETPFVCWLEDHDGETVRCEGFDSAEELLKHWPHAERIGAREFQAYVGGGR